MYHKVRTRQFLIQSRLINLTDKPKYKNDFKSTIPFHQASPTFKTKRSLWKTFLKWKFIHVIQILILVILSIYHKNCIRKSFGDTWLSFKLKPQKKFSSKKTEWYLAWKKGVNHSNYLCYYFLTLLLLFILCKTLLLETSFTLCVFTDGFL